MTAAVSQNWGAASEAEQRMQMLHMRFAEEREQQLLLLDQRDKLVSSLQSHVAINYEDIVEGLQRFQVQKTMRTPVSILKEYCDSLRKTVSYQEVGQPDGPSHAPRFTLTAVVGGVPYTPVRAGSKKDGRNGAAFLAWMALITEERRLVQDSLTQDHTLTDRDRVACLAHIQYLKLVEQNPFCYSGRRVLSAVVMKKGRSYNDWQVVSLGTGNCCITGRQLDIEGRAINDSHAEVVARRAFVRYLYLQLQEAKKNPTAAILKKGKDKRYRVKEGVEFHLYISSAPCGDSATFTRTDSVDPDRRQPIFDSKAQGLLRAKIEAGEGTPPLDPSAAQTLLGLQFGGRLHTMSCSDKVCKWTIVGLQGALLSQLMAPVYMAGLVVGDLYSYGHISRAVYYRLSGFSSPPSLPLPRGYTATLPDLGHGEVRHLPLETERSFTLSANWFLGSPLVEIVEGNRGRCPWSDTDTYSRLCKRAMLDEFKLVWRQLKSCNVDSQLAYHQVKDSAKEYREAERVFYATLQSKGLGTWLHKPEELEYFH